MITKESISQLKQISSIVDLIGSYIQLRKSGSNYSACCPFHNEKTPSFMISEAKGIYHCYGCGVSGDIFNFLMEYEKIEFFDAVEKVASFFGFTLSYESGVRKKDSDILEKFCEFYKKNLPSNQKALSYLKSRGLSSESIEKFDIGVCGASFESVRFVERLNFDKKEALEYGVLGEDNGRFYARFTDRIIFPIKSPAGKVLGFGGRTLNDGLAKYINSPQSKVFNKSRLLYGFNLAKDSIFRDKKIIVTEGYLDVIMLHQAGFNCAVATLGTALTNEHLPLLSKGEPKIILGYDGDKAGINAALKASMMLAKASKDGGVVIFGNGADPADMVAGGKIGELENLFDNPTPFVEFVIEKISQSYDLNNPLQVEKALKEALEFLHSLSPVLQDKYRSFLATRLKLPINLIKTKKQKNVTSTQGDVELGELVVIKSVLEDNSFLDFILEYADERIFEFKKEEFSLLLKGDFGHSSLVGISLDEGIKALSIDELKSQMRILIMQFLQKRLKALPFQKGLIHEERVFEINKIKQKIMKLKKGELVLI